ncbi:MAG: histone deacetylase [Methanobacteriota archaeon]
MGLVFHETYLAQTQPGDHPESPARTAAIVRRLEELGAMETALKPELAAIGDVASVHDPYYLAELQGAKAGYIDPDTYLMPDGYKNALNSAGGALLAARRSFSEKKPYMALLRPPGHHATRCHSMGFCYINNAAVAAKALLPDAKRVAIIDYDVHHGNGTSEIFYDDPDVLYISTHQWGIYPGSGHFTEVGSGEGKGYTVNIPLLSGAGDATFMSAFDEVIEPVVTRFKPGAVLVSLGVDAHYKDFLASLSLSSKGYVELCRRTQEVAKKVCASRIAFLLEGGYHPEALAEVVAGVVKSFDGEDTKLAYNQVSDNECVGSSAIAAARHTHSSQWGT